MFVQVNGLYKVIASYVGASCAFVLLFCGFQEGI